MNHRLKRPPGHYEQTKWVFVRGVDCIVCVMFGNVVESLMLTDPYLADKNNFKRHFSI